MKFKSQFSSAVKLILLLLLLFWCFTWNLPADSDVSIKDSCIQCKEAEVKASSYAILFKKDRSTKQEWYDKISYETSILIPSFREWREIEIEKYEKSFARDRILHQGMKLSRRKLNYASSKCGAKILASNPEARHRLAVLSEKSDEYFLNPCRVKTWFVIELCDAVEITQVELANYELYSSSPKEFSVFWSEIYPTYEWHFLGHFAAEDKRTMQTFDVIEKSLGKFIKVIIHSHHGREHYCPLSVIRVLGFSMEDIEEGENNDDPGLKDEAEVKYIKTSPSKTMNSLQKSIKKEKFLSQKLNSDTKNVCEKFFLHCSNATNINANRLHVNKPICRFLDETLKISNVNCFQLYCPRYPELFSKVFNATLIEKLKTASSNLIKIEPDMLKDDSNYYLNEKDIVKDYEHKKSLRIQKDCKTKLNEKDKKANARMKDYCTVENVQKPGNEDAHLNSVERNFVHDRVECSSNDKLLCNSNIDKTEILTETKLTMKEKHTQEEKETVEEIDSARLINKESVIFN